MTEAGRLDVKISLPGDDGKPRRPGRLLTLNQVLSWIKLQELDDYTYNGLEKIISMKASTDKEKIHNFLQTSTIPATEVIDGVGCIVEVGILEDVEVD